MVPTRSDEGDDEIEGGPIEEMDHAVNQLRMIQLLQLGR